MLDDQRGTEDESDVARQIDETMDEALPDKLDEDRIDDPEPERGPGLDAV